MRKAEKASFPPLSCILLLRNKQKSQPPTGIWPIHRFFHSKVSESGPICFQKQLQESFILQVLGSYLRLFRV